jgi:glycosyltransferase involved in cell wall biosynthesis
MIGREEELNKSSDPSICGKYYILFVGNRSSYKNFTFFIESVAPLLLKNNELQVCCAGGEPFSPREILCFKNFQILHKVHHIQPDDHTMKNLYKNALAFIFPSLYEGFGLPVLEAFSCGCPTLLSNTSSLPEIGSDAALYFDPYDPASLTDALEHIISDNNLRMQLILKGYERSKQFSWEKTANATKKVYEQAVN